MLTINFFSGSLSYIKKNIKQLFCYDGKINLHIQLKNLIKKKSKVVLVILVLYCRGLQTAARGLNVTFNAKHCGPQGIL